MPRKVHGKTGNTYFKDNVEIFGGKAHVHKIPMSKNRYFRTWIDEEKRHLRKSLGTTDLDDVIHKAENLFVEIKADVSRGKKFFGITVEEVAKEFLENELGRVETGKIKKGRWNTVKTQINRHLIGYLVPPKKLGQLTTIRSTTTRSGEGRRLQALQRRQSEMNTPRSDHSRPRWPVAKARKSRYSRSWRDLHGGCSRRFEWLSFTRRLRRLQISTTFETQPPPYP